MTDLSRGGIVTNLDQTLTKEQIAESHKLDHAAQVLDDAKTEARKREGDNFAVYTADEKMTDLQTVTKAFLDKSEREVGNSASVKPVRVVLGDPTSPIGRKWHLAPRDQQAVAEGRFCQNCLQAQSAPSNTQCEWRIPMHGIKGCGWNRIADEFFKPELA